MLGNFPADSGGGKAGSFAMLAVTATLNFHACRESRLGQGRNRQVCRRRLRLFGSLETRRAQPYFFDRKRSCAAYCLCYSANARSAMHAFNS